jgi:transcriptional regulator with PAS, ATPase and Fis domain
LLLQERLAIPIVEIVVSGQDLAQAFYSAKQVTGLERPKIAFHAFKNMVYNIEVLPRILGIDLKIYRLEDTADIPKKIDDVIKDGADIVIGGVRTITLAQAAGFKTLPMHSSDFSIRTALIEALRIVKAREFEKERTQRFKALIDGAAEGIIGVDAAKCINTFNRQAEQLLRCPSVQVLGRPLTDVISGLDLAACFQTGKDSIGQTLKVDSSWFSFNISPIVVNNSVVGAIIAFQDITRIQEIEARIRHEVVAKKMTAKYRFSDILGQSPQIMEARRIAEEFSHVDAAVLILGESGTGKELFAQSIHANSSRKNGPFVAVNCAALPANLLESELFGYVEGAFTGARKKGKPGLFEMAHCGTLFLDEIAEMDPYSQSRLLRVLQEKQVMRLGDDKYIPVDVRFITATNKPLRTMVQKGEFRADLYYRIKVLTVHIPALCQRTGDIIVLAREFLRKYNNEYHEQVQLDAEAYRYLTQYNWPGNVRELQHFMERLVVICKEKMIKGQAILAYWDEEDFADGHMTEVLEDRSSQAKVVLQSQEEIELRRCLDICDYNLTKTAKMLGLSRGTIYRRLHKYDIEVSKTW